LRGRTPRSCLSAGDAVRIAVVKPDYRIIGGFELILDRVCSGLQASGYEVTRISLDVPALPRRAFGIDVPDHIWSSLPEFFSHMTMMEGFRALDLSAYDLVLSTQPPSYSVRHPRIMALFYHHLRIYYDLADLYVAAGFAPLRRHEHATKQLRRVDTRAFDSVAHVLAPSSTVQLRLRRFNRLEDRVTDFFAGLGAAAHDATSAREPVAFKWPLCVSRHEFPKRTELFCLALAHLPEMHGILVGDGGRIQYVRSLAAALACGVVDAASADPRSLWLNTGTLRYELPQGAIPNVDVTGRVSDFELERLYRECLCVVAPSYDEDYGLTALEGMAHSKPVIVCSDGGGLTELVEDGASGFVVEPTGSAIADAIRRLEDDPELARRLGACGREVAHSFTWERATAQLLDGLERTMSRN
jgi:glycosyltransferase involved in cell wall biosynthesis